MIEWFYVGSKKLAGKPIFRWMSDNMPFRSLGVKIYEGANIKHIYDTDRCMDASLVGKKLMVDDWICMDSEQEELIMCERSLVPRVPPHGVSMFIF